MTKKLIFLVLPLLAGCNDRLDEYRMVQQAYPNAKIEVVDFAANESDCFLVVDTNNVARVVYFPNCRGNSMMTKAQIPTPAEAP